MVLRMGQPSSHSSHGLQDGSAFLLLPSWCSAWVSLPPTPLMVFRICQPSSHSPDGIQDWSAFLPFLSWCSGWVSLPPTPLMVFRRGQSSSYSPHVAQDGSAFLLLLWWCSGGVSLSPTPLMVFKKVSLPPTPLMVFKKDQPSSHSSWCSRRSAFLPLLSWCSGWISLPPTPLWVSLPSTPLMVLRMGQPSCHYPHSVLDGSALSSYSPLVVQDGSAFLPLLHHIVFTCSHCDLYQHRCLRTCTCMFEVHPHRAETNAKEMPLPHIQWRKWSKKTYAFAFVLAQCKRTIIKLWIWCLYFFFFFLLWTFFIFSAKMLYGRNLRTSTLTKAYSKDTGTVTSSPCHVFTSWRNVTTTLRQKTSMTERCILEYPSLPQSSRSNACLHFYFKILLHYL